MDKIKLRDESEVGVFEVVFNLTRQNMADILGEWANRGMKDYRDGLALGKLCQNKHRTIQGSIIRICLGIIIGMSVGVEYTDERNETPIAMGKKLAEMVAHDELNMGYMI